MPWHPWLKLSIEMLTDKQEEFLSRCCFMLDHKRAIKCGNCHLINGRVNVVGHVMLSNEQLRYNEDIPVKFGRVTGNFSIADNYLTELGDWCPKVVGGYFSCANNRLRSLSGIPISVKEYINATNNPIETFSALRETTFSYISIGEPFQHCEFVDLYDYLDKHEKKISADIYKYVPQEKVFIPEVFTQNAKGLLKLASLIKAKY